METTKMERILFRKKNLMKAKKKELSLYYGNTPILKNEEDHKIGRCGIDSCEICKRTIPYQVSMEANSEQHLWCAPCENKALKLERKIDELRK